MRYLDQIVTYITQLSAKDFQKQLIIVISVITISIVGIMYYVYQQGSARVRQIKQLGQLTQKVATVLADNARIQKEEDRIQELLVKNKDFNIKSYFEQFCREHNVVPEPNWDTTINPIEGNEKFEEVILPATFKNQNTKKLVGLLDVLDKNDIVYLQELAINKEKQLINVDLTIATKRLRRVLEE
jgi:hypothetical protein